MGKFTTKAAVALTAIAIGAAGIAPAAHSDPPRAGQFCSHTSSSKKKKYKRAGLKCVKKGGYWRLTYR